MLSIIRCLQVIICIAALYNSELVFAVEHNRPVILIDSGHTPKQSGAMSISGIREVVYNDHFVTQLRDYLEQAGFSVVLTRKSDESIGLMDRVAIANRIMPSLFLSIHHDSAQLRYLDKFKINKKLTAYKTIKPIAGFSIFVSEKNSEFAKSYQFAELLGQSFVKLNRLPTLHHAENIAGENREFLNKSLGIYRYDDLLVLKKTLVPAVLLEVGVIVDQQDERFVTDAQNQQLMYQAIVESIKSYINHLGL